MIRRRSRWPAMKKLLVQFTGREAHPLIQFVKYGICGVLATGVDMVLFFLLAWKVFPALGQDELLVRVLGLELPEISEQVRSRHFVLNRSLSFMVSCYVAYFTNFHWVFTPGRHSRRKEITLFYVIGIASYFLGTTLGWGLIAILGMTTTAAYLANIVASVMINYAGRKFIVFHG